VIAIRVGQTGPSAAGLCFAEVDRTVMIGIEERQRAADRLVAKAAENRKHEPKIAAKLSILDGLLHVEFSRIAPPPQNAGHENFKAA